MPLSSINPQISVIIPLCDARGDELECIRSWTHRQTLSRESYQVVLATTGGDPHLESQARELLAPQDLFLEHRNVTMHDLYHLGALASHGQIVLFTELHCLGDPHCLSELKEWFEQTGSVGACLNVRHQNPNCKAEMEQRAFEQQFQLWSQPGHWRKIQARGCALLREVYDEVGGYDGSLELFADEELGAKLHRSGYQLGFAENAFVTHINTTTFTELAEHTGEYVRGECLFRCHPEAMEYEAYVGLPKEWTDALRDHTSANWSEMVTLGKLAIRALTGKFEKGTAGAALAEMLRRVRALTSGKRGRAIMARLSLWHARLRYWFAKSGSEEKLRAFTEWWERMGKLHRIHESEQALQKHALPLPHALGELKADEFPLHHWSGLYALDVWEDQGYRWTEPLVTCRFVLPPEMDWNITFETGNLRGERVDYVLAVLWNGKVLPEEKIERDHGQLQVQVTTSSGSGHEVQTLTLLCRPLKPWKHGSPDRRRLGIPLFSVCCEPVSALASMPRSLSA